MAGQKISDMPVASSVGASDLFVIVQNGTNKGVQGSTFIPDKDSALQNDANVRFNTPQSLNSTEKTRARQNIGAMVDTTIDNVPTANSNNLVKSGGVKSAIDTAKSDLQENIDALEQTVADNKEELQENIDEVAGSIGGKADKVAEATEDNLASLDENGNIADSEIAKDDLFLYDSYSSMAGVGTAENLNDKKATPTEREIGYDTSAGDLSISGESFAQIDEVQGKTVVWNQLADFSTAQNNTLHGVTYTREAGSNLLFLNGLCDANFSLSMMASAKINVKNGHHYYLYADTSFVAGNNNPQITANGTGLPTVYSVNNGTGGKIVTANADGQWQFNLNLYVGNEFNNAKFSVACYDLTQMFGAGNEPSTVDEYYKRKPIVEDEYAYETGKIVNYKGKGIATTGFNQLSSLFEQGNISTTTGENVNNTSGQYWRAKDYIQVIGGENYYFKLPDGYTTSTANASYFFYDENKNYIGHQDNKAGQIVQIDSNCAYVRFIIFFATAITEFPAKANFNLSWSGYRNGDYEPYWREVKDLILPTQFADGMNEVGTAHDSLFKDKAIKRIGKVDLGTLNWGSGSNNRFNSESLNGLIKNYANGTKHTDLKCSLYTPQLYNSSNLVDNIMYVQVGYNYENVSSLIIRNTQYSTATAFKTAMSGVYLYYELAEPVETPISPELNLSYRVADYGTEEVIVADGVESTPLNALIRYNKDFTRSLSNLLDNTPDLPTSNGTYVQKCVVSGGVATVQWVAE